MQMLQRSGGWHVEMPFRASSKPGAPRAGDMAVAPESPTSAPASPFARPCPHPWTARELARIAFRYDLHRGLAPVAAPLFCVATESSRLKRAAAIAAGRVAELSPVSDGGEVGHFPLPPLVVELGCPEFQEQGRVAPAWLLEDAADLAVQAGGCAPARSTVPMLRLPTQMLVVILAQLLPAAAAGGGASAAESPCCLGRGSSAGRSAGAGAAGGAAQVARTCRALAGLMQSGTFWAAALEMRYRVVPCIAGLATILGAAPSRHAVSTPNGLAAGSPGAEPGYVLVGPSSSALQLQHGIDDARGGHTDHEGEQPKPPELPLPCPIHLPCRPPAVFLAMTERGPTVVLLEGVKSGTCILEITAEVFRPAGRRGTRGYFGGKHEIWVDLLDLRALPDGARFDREATHRQRFAFNFAKRGNEIRWVRFCRPGELPTLHLQTILSPAHGQGDLQAPRLFLVAARDLTPLTELTWPDLQVCHAFNAAHADPPRALASSAPEPAEARAHRELERFAAALRLQRRAGAFAGAEGAHAFVLV